MGERNPSALGPMPRASLLSWTALRPAATVEPSACPGCDPGAPDG